MEIWKPVVGYEGLYEVSNQGNVRSLNRTVKSKNKVLKPVKGRMLKKSTDDIGRVKVSLYKNNKHINKRVSILVAEAFIGPRPEGLYVLHGKRGVSVNIPENLSYGTPSKNQGDDRLRDGTDNRGEKNGRAKLTKDQVIRVKINKEKWTSSRWAEEFGVSRKAIRKIVAGETWGWLEP